MKCKVKWCSCCGKHYGSSSKIKNRITIWPSNFTSGYKPRKTESRVLRYVYTHDHSSIIHSQWNMKAT
jgi:hypothetical protein